ncbi:MAG: flagellar hook-length control protein FliK [Alphaproteobacteria bacterium]|nr:flagellar hook-length control protein FliK [Alphaproteobacteria bacterium]
MEVKDINKTALAMLARGSAAAMGGAMVGDAFSSLLESWTQPQDFSKDVKFAAKDNAKPEKITETNSSNQKAPVKTDNAKEDTSVREGKEADRAENKNDSRAEERKTDKKEERPSDNADAVEEEKDDSRVTGTNVLPDLSLLFAGTVQPAAEAFGEAAFTETTVVSDQSATEAFGEAAFTETAVVSDQRATEAFGEAVFTETAVVSDLPAVTAEIPVMQAETVQAAAPAVDVSGDAVKQNGAGEIDISALQMVTEETVIEAAPVVFEDVKAKTAGKTQLTNTGAGQQTVAEDVPAEEGVSAENIKFGDKEIKLDVKVENDGADFSYRKTSDLSVANIDAENVAADEAAEVSKSFVHASEGAKSRPLSSAGEQHPQMQSQNVQPQNVAVAPAAGAQVVNNADIAFEAAKETVTEVKGMQMVQVAGGSEFVNAARARTAEQLKSPVNDAYKGMSREVAEQVKVNITKSAVKGVDKIDISLKPEELGHIEIKMHLAKNGKLQAEIVASRPETMEILQKEAQNLQKSFEDAGFQTDESSLSFSCREDNAQSGRQEQNYEMRRFIGEALDNDFSNDNLSGYAESGWDGQSGLNIRV